MLGALSNEIQLDDFVRRAELRIKERVTVESVLLRGAETPLYQFEVSVS